MAGKLTVLADTSGIIALLDKSDRHYIWNYSPKIVIFQASQDPQRRHPHIRLQNLDHLP